MKLVLATFVILILGLGRLFEFQPAPSSQTFTARLIRGSDVQPEENSRVDPGLARRLALVFRWKHYQEVAQGSVKLVPEHGAMVRLAHNIVAHLRLRSNDTAEYAVAVNGTIVRKTTRHRRDRGPWLAGIDGGGTNGVLFVAIEWVGTSRPSVK